MHRNTNGTKEEGKWMNATFRPNPNPTVNPKPAGKPSPSPQPVNAATANSSGEWKCSRCTLINAPNAMKCRACWATRLSSSSPAAPNQHLPGVGSSQKRALQLLTCREMPGKYFLDLVPGSPVDVKTICDTLLVYAKAHTLNPSDVEDFQEKVEQLMENADLSIPNIAEVTKAKALMFLYSAPGWVVEYMNAALRNDSQSKLTAFAPLIWAIIKGFECLPQYHAKVDTVYRRTKLTDEFLQFYEPNKRFVWPSFTSTSTRISDSGAIFGTVLFVIAIRPHMAKYALNICEFSQVADEDEILLLANMGFRVTKVDSTPDNSQYPDTIRVIHICADFVVAC
jgi:ribosomal protein L40E